MEQKTMLMDGCDNELAVDGIENEIRSPLSLPNENVGQQTPTTNVQCNGIASLSRQRPSAMRMNRRHLRSWWILIGIFAVLVEMIPINVMGEPTQLPTLSSSPTSFPTNLPSLKPSGFHSELPSARPSLIPSTSPSVPPSLRPSLIPSAFPSDEPSSDPTTLPSVPPSSSPTSMPSGTPSLGPTLKPSSGPSAFPSSKPSMFPSTHPSTSPSNSPSVTPSNSPSTSPSQRPSLIPSASPSKAPSLNPSSDPTSLPSKHPSLAPSSKPSSTPSHAPSRKPSIVPSASPSGSPSEFPSSRPSSDPTSKPSRTPTSSPSSQPSTFPSIPPTSLPSSSPSVEPTTFPSNPPTSLPSSSPSIHPTSIPSVQPSVSLSPSSAPTDSPSSIPSDSPSLNPTSKPSIYPTSAPSSFPSSSPSYSLQSFEFYITMEFDELQNFEGKAKKIFEQEVDTMIKLVLDRNGDSFRVASSIERTEIVVPEIETDGGEIRSLSLENYGIGFNRKLQVSSTGLRVILRVFVDVRSGNTFDKEKLISFIKTALDEQSEREAFIIALQLSDSTFAPINVMSKFTIDEEEIPLVERSGPIPWEIVGPSIGVGALVISVIGFLLLRRRRDSMSFVDGDFYDPPPTVDPRVSRTIEVEQDAGEISTLGDPVYPGGQQMFAAVQSFQNEDEATNRSSMSADYDYKRAYGGVGDSPSVSTVGGDKSAYMPPTRGGRSNEDENDGVASRQEAGSDMSSRVRSMSENISLFSEDNSFEAMYGEEERIVVIAPAGKLGMVIDTPSGGIPVVHAIKESSVLYNQIRIGDRLISVDDQDTTTLSAIRVSKLISSRASNPQRVMVFLRSTADP